MRISDRSAGVAKPGTRPFWLAVAGVVAWIGASIWLRQHDGWPDKFGFSCHGRGCLLIEPWYSRRLLDGKFWDFILFLDVWLPVALIAAAAILSFRRRSKTDRPSSPDQF